MTEQDQQHPRKVQKSIAILLFAISGFIVFVCGLLCADATGIFGTAVFILCGIGLCVAGIVYAFLCRRECRLTGPGIAGVVLSCVGIGMGAIMTACFAAYYVIFL